MFVLIFGTASTSLVNDAYAQNDMNILLRIASQADSQIENQLNNSYGDEWPEDIRSLYDEGHKAVESIEDSLDNNPEQAKKDFLIAMKSFKQISKMISEPTTESKTTAYYDSDRYLSSQLDRIEKYVKTLKTISEKHGSEINFSKVDFLIQQAREQITGKTGNPSDIINQLKDLINSIKEDIRDSASDEASDRVKQFVNKQLDNIERKLVKASNADADQSQIEEAYQLIDKIRNLISENQIDNAKIVFHDLNKLLKNIEHSVR
jgi:vacuolar-type H+-ATPase subunit I/STV1